MASTTIDISDFCDIKRIKLLELMWNNMKPARFFTHMNISPPDFGSRTNALETIKNGFIDYYNGRCIKTDLSQNSLNSFMYDRDTYVGKLKELVDIVRSN